MKRRKEEKRSAHAVPVKGPVVPETPPDADRLGPGARPEDGRFSFFQHKDCEYFPCHETRAPEDFNCLFCYCPLYALGEECGGSFTYTEKGVKDCSACLVPHGRHSYAYIEERFPRIAKLAQRKQG